MDVAIYFKNGNTAYFKQVDNLELSHNDLSFEYFGESSQQQKEAVFFISEIAGYSVTAGALDE